MGSVPSFSFQFTQTYPHANLKAAREESQQPFGSRLLQLSGEDRHSLDQVITTCYTNARVGEKRAAAQELRNRRKVVLSGLGITAIRMLLPPSKMDPALNGGVALFDTYTLAQYIFSGSLKKTATSLDVFMIADIRTRVLQEGWGCAVKNHSQAKEMVHPQELIWLFQEALASLKTESFSSDISVKDLMRNTEKTLFSQESLQLLTHALGKEDLQKTLASIASDFKKCKGALENSPKELDSRRELRYIFSALEERLFPQEKPPMIARSVFALPPAQPSPRPNVVKKPSLWESFLQELNQNSYTAIS